MTSPALLARSLRARAVAAGARFALTAAMVDQIPVRPELAVDRFGTLDDARRRALHDAAMRLYSDIYANEAAG